MNTKRDSKLNQIIKIAILAVGGQGGGVLTNWIEGLARANGYETQATSVAGVAQRTGATIYYIEMAKKGSEKTVFSLAPAAGDIDIMICAELMEAGRAIGRQFVTPNKTTLIASAHRVLAVSEKSVPGDGVADADAVKVACEIAAQKLVMFDMDRVALENGSVISSSLFGALAGSGALPIKRDAYEDAIRNSGKGVEASLRAFGVAYELAISGERLAEPKADASIYSQVNGNEKLTTAWDELLKALTELPKPAQEIARHGLQKVVDFQDIEYGKLYLDRIIDLSGCDNKEHDYLFTREAAKYIANAMAYDDMIRVADLKTRLQRFQRINNEMSAGENSVMAVTEFMHPRAEEIVSMLPVKLGESWSKNPKIMGRIDRIFNRGRRIRSDSLFGFLQLYLIGGLKGWRLKTLRHNQEMAHLNGWLEQAKMQVDINYDVAIEVLRARRLIKGYSDTHARGLSKYDRVMMGISSVSSRDDAAEWARRLITAALNDEQGDALDGALKTIESFS